MATLRFQRRQPGGLEVRGVSRQRISSPEVPLDMFDNNRMSSVLVQSNVVNSRRPLENMYGNNQEYGAVDLPPPVITPPMASPSLDDELEERGPADWTTGAMTERSSVSWMDEFDKQTTKTVERMFREIDYALYESRETSQSNLLSTSDALGQECEDWSSSFPHMRVMGQPLTTPNSALSKTRERQISTPILMGFQERAPRSPSPDSTNDIDAEVETVFAIDGKGSEVVRSAHIPIPPHDDYRRSQISLPSTLHSTRSRMAPSLATGTPILRTREELVRQLTWEVIWPVVARCIRPLLLALKADKVHSMYSTPVPDNNKIQAVVSVTGQSSSITTSRLAQSRPAGATFFTSSPKNASGQPMASTGSAETQRHLGSLLLISSKQINTRKQESLENNGSIPPIQFQPVQFQQAAVVPASAIVPAPQPTVNRVSTSQQQQRPTSGARVPSASARGRLGRGRLHPMDRPKTPSAMQQDDYIFDGLRGQKLHTAAELRPQQSSFGGVLAMPKNSPLPPLHHSYGGLASSGVGALPTMIGTAQSTGDFLSVAPVIGSAALVRGTVQRPHGVTTTSRAPSAAISHERPPPTFRMATDMFAGPSLTNALSGRPVLGMPQSNNSLYVLNRSNTLLNVTGVGVNGPTSLDEFDRLAAANGSGVTGRAPATAIGMARASLVTSSYATGHGVGR